MTDINRYSRERIIILIRWLAEDDRLEVRESETEKWTDPDDRQVDRLHETEAEDITGIEETVHDLVTDGMHVDTLVSLRDGSQWRIHNLSVWDMIR